MKAVVRWVLVLVVWISLQVSAQAQCAMCRTTLENNVSNGDIGIAAGINFGILYLFAAPYLIIATLAFFWYRSSKNARRNQYA